MQDDAIAGMIIVLVGLLGAVLLFGMVAGLIAGRFAARAAARDARGEAAPPAPPPATGHGFPVIVDEPPAVPAEPIGTGPGRYRVSGVVAATKVDVTMRVNADSPANAKVKAELSGVVVTDVTKEA